MLKIIALIRRRSDMSPEAFDRHWRESHPPYVTALPGVRRYVQSPALRHKRSWPYDGMSELWFDSLRDIAAAFDAPEAEGMREDEARFIDTIDWFIVDGQTIREIELSPPAASAEPSTP
jgi:uncharacterized protein (TIGR02118 family)